MPTTRRHFLAFTAAAVAAASVHGYPANEMLNIACIGTGGRCRALMKSLAGVPGVRLAAVCDIWETALAEARKLADPKVIVAKNFKEVLALKEIDAVVIGSPDHWHVPMTVAACAAKKHVYVEKPLTHKLAEGKAVVAAQNEHQCIVQVGTQQRSMPHIAKARELLKEGRIGQVVKVHMTWNRNVDRLRRVPLNIDPKSVDWKAFLGSARDQPFDEYRFRNWRWFWDFGGGIFTDLMVHWIDVAHWFLDLDQNHPEKAVSLGEHVKAKDVWETPDTVQTILSYPGGVQMHFEGTFANARGGACIEFMGTEGTLYIDRGRYEIHPDWNKKGKPEELVLGTGRRGADFYDKPDGELLHLTNWVECVRSGKKPNSPAESGVAAAAAAHLANQALRTGQTAKGA
jgi:predicted dehydrogenase